MSQKVTWISLSGTSGLSPGFSPSSLLWLPSQRGHLHVSVCFLNVGRSTQGNSFLQETGGSILSGSGEEYQCSTLLNPVADPHTLFVNPHGHVLRTAVMRGWEVSSACWACRQSCNIGVTEKQSFSSNVLYHQLQKTKLRQLQLLGISSSISSGSPSQLVAGKSGACLGWSFNQFLTRVCSASFHAFMGQGQNAEPLTIFSFVKAC